MKSIEESISNKINSQSIWIKNIEANIANLKAMSLNFRFLEIDIAVKAIKDKNFQESKRHFYTASLIDELRIKKYNDDLFTFGLPSISYPILSDSEELIQRYAKLRYHSWGNMKGMDENVLNGKSDIWCNTVQFFMANDKAGVERNLNIIEVKTLPKLPKKQEILKDDYEFYKALFVADKAKIEEVLEKLVSPKIHKQRNDNNLLSQYVSFPALGYAKLAWRKGIEAEVDSSLIPRELLPTKPLEKYEVSYTFLNEGN
jgi:Immunity protein 49